MRITIACPLAHITDANQLSRALGTGPEDDRTYGEAKWADARGNLYAVASMAVGAARLDPSASGLTEPAWGADLAAAERARALLRFFGGGEADFSDAPPSPLAAPDRICAILAEDAAAALVMLGLTRQP